MNPLHSCLNRVSTHGSGKALVQDHAKMPRTEDAEASAIAMLLLCENCGKAMQKTCARYKAASCRWKDCQVHTAHQTHEA